MDVQPCQMFFNLLKSFVKLGFNFTPNHLNILLNNNVILLKVRNENGFILY
jgi:hypothetical protein